MTEILNRLTEYYSVNFFIRQFLVIVFLYCVGFFVVRAVFCKKNTIEEANTFYTFLLAFPTGISLFIISGIFLLICHIKYNALSALITVITLAALIFVISKPGKSVLKLERKKIPWFLVVFLLIILALSGVVSVGFSNDSMYYYYAYPHEIVTNGYLSEKFDIFLTDAGQGTAIINTLPFLFSYNENFGVMNLFNFSFICFFYYAVYEESISLNNRNKSHIFALLTTFLLATTMPFVLISKWAIANVYFMEMMFICVYLNYKFKDRVNDIIILRSILITALSFVRIEGAVFAGFVLLIYMSLSNVKKRDVLIGIMPVFVLQTAYFVRIFLTMDIQATYTFMTKEKAVVAIAFIVFVLIYSLICSNDPVIKLPSGIMKLASPANITFAGLIGVNLLLLLYDRGLFLSNVRTFAKNMMLNSGWGFFAGLVFVLILLVPKVRIKDLYFDYIALGFFLVAFAACFARGDELRIDLYDSGNRVLLQIVPFVIYAFAFRYIKAFDILHHKEQKS